ncbi:MAG: hypothetical protein QF921_14445, partial [Pseudomonadales bacterium]|nr:hypothetical protein [Pseudomonadales bacterium]
MRRKLALLKQYGLLFFVACAIAGPVNADNVVPDPSFETGTAQLDVSEDATTSTVNLTTQGLDDWIKWGHTAASDVDRKTGVAQLISDA